jgi:hypothetical protein
MHDQKQRVNEDKPLGLSLAELKRVYTLDHDWDAFNRNAGRDPFDLTFEQNRQWQQFLQTCSDQTEDGGSKPFEPVLLSSINRDPPAPLLLGRLDPAGHTMLFGPGGIGKGVLTCYWLDSLVKLGYSPLILDYENHAEEWARRLWGLGGADAVGGIGHIAPLALGKGPLWKHADAINEKMQGQVKPYLIIDSVVMACAGADPTDSTTAQLYFEALQQIEAPSLNLAHVTKLHDPRYPFGSVFWHNVPRMSWSLMPKGDSVLLQCRKHNNYPPQGAATITTTWRDGMLGEVSETRATLTLMDQIVDALSGGPLTLTAIAAALNEGLPAEEKTTSKVIRETLRRELAKGLSGRVTVAGDDYLLRPENES